MTCLNRTFSYSGQFSLVIPVFGILVFIMSKDLFSNNINSSVASDPRNLSETDASVRSLRVFKAVPTDPDKS